MPNEPWSPGSIAASLKVFFFHHPTIVDSEFNRDLIIKWGNEFADGEFSQPNLDAAAEILRYKLKVYLSPSPPKPPPKPKEILARGQLSIHASEHELRKSDVTPAQVRDYLRRLREHNARQV